MKKWIVCLLFLVLILVVDNSENVSAKSKANVKADKAYMKLVKKICEEKCVLVEYYFKDMTGDGVHEAIIQYHPQDGGSGDVFQVYSYENGKTKLILNDGGYGIYRLDIYKESQTFIIYQSGHGHESRSYYNLVDGEFKCVLGKGRSNAGETGPWGYYSYQSYEDITKSKFDKQVKELCKGKKKKFDIPSGYSSYYEQSYKESIKTIIDDIKLFELAMLNDHNIEFGKVELTNEMMARAAAVIINDITFICYDQYDLEFLGEDFATSYYSFNEEEFDNNGKDLFGKNMKLEYLSTEIKSWINDAYKDKSLGYVIVHSPDPEDIYEELSLDIKKKDNSYTATKKVYWGHAGSYKSEANRQITYTFKKSDSSKYGYIITGIKITNIEGEKRRQQIKALSTAKVGDTVKFGEYLQEYGLWNLEASSIEWVVLSKENNKLLLLSKHIIDCMPYNIDTTTENANWEKSNIRTWLNDSFYNQAFHSDEMKLISSTKLKNKVGGDTTDKVFLLDYSDLINTKYGFSLDGSKMDIARRCSPTAYAKEMGAGSYDQEALTLDGGEACFWWLRDVNIEEYGAYASIVTAEGMAVNYIYPVVRLGDVNTAERNFYNEIGVRPAIYVEIAD